MGLIGGNKMIMVRYVGIPTIMEMGFHRFGTLPLNTVIDLIHENKASIQRGQKHLLRIHLMKCGVHVTKLF